MEPTITRRTVLGAIAGATVAKTLPAHAQPADAMGSLDGVGIAQAIQSGQLKIDDVVNAAIARAQRANDQYGLNFTVTEMYAAPRHHASIPLGGPLAGVPTLVKDLTDVSGVRTAAGSRAYLNNIAVADAPIVTAMLNAGLVVIGKSSTPEFGLNATTEPVFFGPTRNPWAPDYSSGGSSGGAAAAVAAGVVPIAHGSDGGGSLRIPASCCGLFALKPSRGRLIGAPPSTIPPLYDTTTDGCITRSVRDSAAWLDAMERKTGQGTLPPVGRVAGPSATRLKIGVQVASYDGKKPHPEVIRVLKETVNLCSSLGHNVFAVKIPISMPAFAEASYLAWCFGAQSSRNNARLRLPPGANEADYLEPLTLALAARADAAGPQGFIPGSPAYLQLQAAAAAYDAAFASMDVYLTPVLSRPPAMLDEFSPNNPSAFLGLGDYSPFTRLQNIAGAPAMSVPLGATTRGGLPIGMHFSALKGQERTLLELAFELEQAGPWQPWAQRFPKAWTG